MAQIPTVGFLYIAGWIGYVGRQYLILAKEEQKPREKEYIIDVPLALKLAYQGAGWPFRAVRELLVRLLVAFVSMLRAGCPQSGHDAHGLYMFFSQIL